MRRIDPDPTGTGPLPFIIEINFSAQTTRRAKEEESKPGKRELDFLRGFTQTDFSHDIV